MAENCFTQALINYLSGLAFRLQLKDGAREVGAVLGRTQDVTAGICWISRHQWRRDDKEMQKSRRTQISEQACLPPSLSWENNMCTEDVLTHSVGLAVGAESSRSPLAHMAERQVCELSPSFQQPNPKALLWHVCPSQCPILFLYVNASLSLSLTSRAIATPFKYTVVSLASNFITLTLIIKSAAFFFCTSIHSKHLKLYTTSGHKALKYYMIVWLLSFIR